MTKDEIIEELIAGYLKIKSLRKHNVYMDCIEIIECSVNDKNCKKQCDDSIYAFRDIVFNDDDEPVRKLLESQYYIEIVYAMLGIEQIECKSEEIDFDSTSNYVVAEFSDLEYISQIDKYYYFCIDRYKENDLCQKYRVSAEINIKYLTNIVNIEFNFDNSMPYARRVFYDESGIYLKCTALAIPKKDKRDKYNVVISTWGEILIQSIASYQYGEYLSATQLCFTALDRCIKDEYNLIYDYLKTVNRDNKNKTYIDILEKMTGVFSHPDSADVLSKLEHIMKMLDCYEEYEEIKALLDPYRKIRNMLSHGNDSDNTDLEISRYNYDFKNNYKKLLYDILKVVYLIEYPDCYFDEVLSYN